MEYVDTMCHTSQGRFSQPFLLLAWLLLSVVCSFPPAVKKNRAEKLKRKERSRSSEVVSFLPVFLYTVLLGFLGRR